ncbi:sigma-54-dependent transcriptional regulator [Jeotgalibacillus alimentarius]|nr:sigma-54-dependent transcriptional regulator [Jeotgalibacillus alimentarius]
MLIAPYNGMAEISKQLTLPSDVMLDIKVANLEDGEKYARQAEDEGYDILISRGGTASAIEKAVSLPVIHIDITGYDMLRVFTLIKNIDKKVALVGFSPITHGAATLCNILEYDVEVKTVHASGDVKPMLEALKANGFQIVIGDVITVQVAESLGLQGVLITSGKEALLQAVEEGRRAFLLSKKVKHNFSLLHEMFEYFPYPLALLNERAEIVEHNDVFISADFKEKMTYAALQQDITDLLESGKSYWSAYSTEEAYYAVHLFRVNSHTAGLMFYPSAPGAMSDSISVQYAVKPLPLIGDSDFTQGLKRQITKLSQHRSPVYITGAAGTGRSALAVLLHVEQFGSHVPLISINGADFTNDDAAFLAHTLRPLQSATILVHQSALMHDKLQEQLNNIIQSQSASYQIIYILDHYTTDAVAVGEYIHLLPLSLRKDDIPAFANYFLTAFHADSGSETLGIKKDAMTSLQQYEWPGNLIELKQTIHELSRISAGYFIEKEQVEHLLQTKKKMQVSLQMDTSITLKEMERRMILQVLQEEDGNQSKAAKRLGINRSTLWRKLSD